MDIDSLIDKLTQIKARHPGVKAPVCIGQEGREIVEFEVDQVTLNPSDQGPYVLITIGASVKERTFEDASQLLDWSAR